MGRPQGVPSSIPRGDAADRFVVPLARAHWLPLRRPANFGEPGCGPLRVRAF